MAVEDALAVHFAPAVRDERGAGVQLQLANRGTSVSDVDWQLTFLEQYPMENGAFQLKSPVPFQADFIDPDQGRRSLQPGEAIAIEARLGNIDPLTLYRVRAQWTVDGRIQSSERYVGGCAGVPKVSGGVTFDGAMGDANWGKAVVIPMDQPHQFCYLNRRTAKWDGPDDLSATMHLMWDDEHLYLGMKVTDDIYRQPEIKGRIWRGDGLQFLFDPRRGHADKPGRYDYSAALTRLGPQAWCGATADAALAPAGDVTEDFKASIALTGEGGNMIYELAIPWHRISPFEAKPGANLGLGMIVNNDDGQIRDSFMAWFGCAHSKQLDMNGDLILLDG